MLCLLNHALVDAMVAYIIIATTGSLLLYNFAKE